MNPSILWLGTLWCLEFRSAEADEVPEGAVLVHTKPLRVAGLAQSRSQTLQPASEGPCFLEYSMTL